MPVADNDLKKSLVIVALIEPGEYFFEVMLCEPIGFNEV